MGLPKPRTWFTVDEYLAIERSAEERHEYVDGEIFAMAGESWFHGKVTVNLVGIFTAQLRGTSCQAQFKDTKVRSGPSLHAGGSSAGLFSYPDVVVVCGEPEFHDAHRDVVLNPTVIFEVLSPSTENFDRGDKCRRYQTWNPTLRDYLMVAQDQPLVEQFTRQDDGTWTLRRYEGLDATVELPSIRCRLPMTDVYERVSFTESP